MMDKLGAEILVGDVVAVAAGKKLRLGVVKRVHTGRTDYVGRSLPNYVSVQYTDLRHTTRPVYKQGKIVVITHSATSMVIKEQVTNGQLVQAR